MLTTTAFSFDFGDFDPNNRTAGVPFIQMLATTKMHDAQAEFQQVRAQQVQQSNQQLAAGSLSFTGHPSLRDVQQSLQTLARRLSRENPAHPPAPAHLRVVVTQHMRPLMPVRVMHHVAGCMNQMADAFGPVAMALLAGTFGIMLMMLLVGAVLGVRELVRYRRRAAGYEPLDLDCEAKDADVEGAVVFDAEEYNHHVMTQRTTI